MMKKKVIYTALIAGVLLLNLIARLSRPFSDFYVNKIFPLWVGSYGRVTGLFPFSVGEWLLGAQGCLMGLAALLLVVALIAWFAKGRKRFPFRGFWRFLGNELIFVAWLMTLNCFILYQASPFGNDLIEKAVSKCEQTDSGAEYDSFENLIYLYNDMVRECNELCDIMERDERGRIIYSGSVLHDGTACDMQDKAVEAVHDLEKEFPRLKGYYSRPKALLSSDFMCQQYMLGYYFPFSLEANYNNVAYIMNLPSTMCHELSHLRGYIFEDEANFLGYLACVQSDDDVFRYSGDLSVLGYIAADINKQIDADPDKYIAIIESIGLEEPDPRITQDDVFVLSEDWDRIEEEAVIPTETVSEAADAFIDGNLKANGVSDGKISYSRVVRLILAYRAAKG